MVDDWRYPPQRPRPSGSRRGFLKAALLMGVSSAAGITASWLVLKDDEMVVAQIEPQLQVSPLPTKPFQPPPTLAPVISGEAQPNPAELAAQITTLQNENYRLQMELDSLQTTSASKNTELASYQSQVADLMAQLQNSQGRVNLLNGLLALYTHLDSLELDEMVETGVNEITNRLQQALVQVPILRNGVAVTATVLDQLELSLPSIQDGLVWLGNLVNQVADALQAMENALAQVVEPFQPLANKLSAFSAKILDWIPFGWGENIEMGLNGIIGVLTHVPELVRAAGPTVLDPLARWFNNGQDMANIKTSLIDVVRGQTMQPGSQLATDLELVDEGVKTDVVSPIQSRIDARRLVRQQITRYREQNGL